MVVDNSSAFRMAADVPLVIPEINARRISEHQGIIAIPNCAAITALVPLWPIHQQNRIKRVILSTYQAASGAGAAAMEELTESTRAHLNGDAYAPKVMPHPYAFNLFNHNTAIDPETGYNEEESKVIKETKKIFEDERIGVGVTCVRVPVLRAHCEAVTFECEQPITEDEVREILRGAPGIRIVDDRVKNYFPMPIDASGQDDVLVGRIRKDLSDPSGHSISMFVAADQLLKGAALNAIQIAELVLKLEGESKHGSLHARVALTMLSSPRTRAPIRRSAVVQVAKVACRSKTRRYWVTAFAGTTLNWLATPETTNWRRRTSRSDSRPPAHAHTRPSSCRARKRPRPA